MTPVRAFRQRCGEAPIVDRRVLQACPTLDQVREHRIIRCPSSRDADVDDLGVEDLLDPVADQVVHRLHLEVLGETPLHVVDQRELGVPLAGLLEQPSVLERDAQTPGDRGQQTHVALAERMLSVDVLERDHARRLAPDEERDEDRRLRQSRPATHWCPELLDRSAIRSLIDDGFPRLERRSCGTP